MGSSADNFNLAPDLARSADQQAPRLLPMYYASAEKPMSVFLCRDAKKCPGGYPGSHGQLWELTLLEHFNNEDLSLWVFVNFIRVWYQLLVPRTW